MNKLELIEKLNQIQKLTDDCLSIISQGENVSTRKTTPKATGKPERTKSVNKGKVDFSTPLRPFVKQFSKDMNGPEKFTLILAHLAKGNLTAQIRLEDVEKAWNSMTAILKMNFNRFYSQTAKDNDWVLSQKRGIYSLRPSWMNILD